MLNNGLSDGGDLELTINTGDINMQELESHQVLVLLSIVLVDRLHLQWADLEVLHAVSLLSVVLASDGSPGAIGNSGVQVELSVLEEPHVAASDSLDSLENLTETCLDGTHVLHKDSLLIRSFGNRIKVEADSVLVTVEHRTSILTIRKLVSMLVYLDTHLGTIKRIVWLGKCVLTHFLNKGEGLNSHRGGHIEFLYIVRLRAKLLAKGPQQTIDINFLVYGVAAGDNKGTSNSSSGRNQCPDEHEWGMGA